TPRAATSFTASASAKPFTWRKPRRRAQGCLPPLSAALGNSPSSLHRSHSSPLGERLGEGELPLGSMLAGETRALPLPLTFPSLPDGPFLSPRGEERCNAAAAGSEASPSSSVQSHALKLTSTSRTATPCSRASRTIWAGA